MYDGPDDSALESDRRHYPETAYQGAFAVNVGLQIAAGVWLGLTWDSFSKGGTL